MTYEEVIEKLLYKAGVLDGSEYYGKTLQKMGLRPKQELSEEVLKWLKEHPRNS